MTNQFRHQKSKIRLPNMLRMGNLKAVSEGQGPAAEVVANKIIVLKYVSDELGMLLEHIWNIVGETFGQSLNKIGIDFERFLDN